MKLAILFCVVAFACAAQASPADLNKTAEAQKRGAMIDAVKEKLELAKNKLDSLIHKASDILREKINDAKKQAEDLAEKLKTGALETSKKVYESLQKILDKVSRLEDLVTDEIKKAANKLGNYEAEAVQSRKVE